MLWKVKILKIGGSVITHKDKDSKLNLKALKNIASEIKKWMEESTKHRLIFISGAGSFGHPLARKYNINEETARNKDRFGFLKTTTNMQKMGNMITVSFHKFGVPLFPIQTSSIFITNKGRIVNCSFRTILKSIEDNQIPFLWGDAVFDVSHKYRALSGDQISSYLYEKLDLSELLFGTNVNGVYTDDPHKSRNAKIITNINNDNFKEVLELLSFSPYIDVTKGMKGKIEEIYAIKKRPVKCIIYKALVKNNTYRVLSGEKIGTTIFLEK